jgi:hypothetical protein
MVSRDDDADNPLQAHREYLRRSLQLSVPEQEFTPLEVARLRKYGHWFAALSEGCIKPTTRALRALHGRTLAGAE